ncbi:MAG: four helix bundle protein [Anaerolineae bacterium]|nr:four helix bundle protein [Anaerolineae bacterium]
MGYVKSYRDLFVYQEARALSREIFMLSKRFPKEEAYSLTDQVRRSSRSIGAQIAEAWAKRRYENHFISKLTDADGEQQETQHWIETALDCDYLSQKEADVLLDKCQRIGRLLGSMIAKSGQFCGTSAILRESAPEYFIENPPITDNRLPITTEEGEP